MKSSLFDSFVLELEKRLPEKIIVHKNGRHIKMYFSDDRMIFADLFISENNFITTNLKQKICINNMTENDWRCLMEDVSAQFFKAIKDVDDRSVSREIIDSVHDIVFNEQDNGYIRLYNWFRNNLARSRINNAINNNIIDNLDIDEENGIKHR